MESATISLEETIPTLALTKAELGEGMGLLTVMVKAGLAASNGAARRLVEGGACFLNDAKIDDFKKVITADDFASGPITLRAGKKNRRRITLD